MRTHDFVPNCFLLSIINNALRTAIDPCGDYPSPLGLQAKSSSDVIYTLRTPMPSHVAYRRDSKAYDKYDLVRFQNPVIIRPLEPKLVIFILLLTLIPLTKVLFPFWTYFEPSPFEPEDVLMTIPKEIKFLVEPKIPSTLDMLVMINSQAKEVKLREKIRQSWGNSSHYDRDMTKIMFVLGDPQSSGKLTELRWENRKHNDILVTDVEEDYYALSLKTYAMLAYQAERAPKAKCLVKADSDNVLNLFNFEILCEETKAPVILGKCNVDRRVLRSNSKWSIPQDLYEEPLWPRYCSTGTYVFCGRTVPQRLLQAIPTTPFFDSINFRRLPEDVLFTGIFPEIAKIRRKNIGGFTFRDQPLYKCRDVKYTYSIHMHREKDPIRYYRRLKSLEGGVCLKAGIFYL